MQSHNITGSNYGFSAARIEDLGASEYTLVDIEVDRSGSVGGFGPEIEKALKTVLQACRHSPRADNLMLRVNMFNHSLSELHGFKPLTDINVDDYTGSINPGGGTALYDASHNGVEAVARYGKDLAAQHYEANAIVFVITDGYENGNSTMTANSVRDALKAAVHDEDLESLRSVLIGVNVDPASGTSSVLDDFKNTAGFDQYVAAGDASESNLAKLADFVSKSISAQSQALGTGGASQSLTF
jgi:uncharacterized protein YegL